MSGYPLDWLSWQEAACLYSRDMIGWTYGDHVLTLRGGTARCSDQQTRLHLHSVVACRGRICPESQRTPTLNRRAIFRRDQRLCLYCGQQYHENDLTLDHIHPLSRGGAHSWMNLVTACRRCNQRKGDRTPEECGMELLAIPYRPNRAEFLALVNSHRILADQMTFLSSHFSQNWRTQ